MVLILDNFEIWIEWDGVGDQWNCAFSLSDEWQLLKPEILPNSVASEYCWRKKFNFFLFFCFNFFREDIFYFSTQSEESQ